MIILFSVLITNCNEDDNPVKPKNHFPQILSVDVFPDVIGLNDSVIVICNATDPDGDTLVYDWITDGRVKIKGGHANYHWLYHTYENTRIFYPKPDVVNLPIDTLWVQCFVRDVRGGEVAETVIFVVKQNLEGGD